MKINIYMKIRGIRIHDYYTGLCNQLIRFLHGVMRCVCDGIDIAVIDGFKIDLNEDVYCPFDEIIDMESFSRYTYEQYGLMIIDKSRFDIRIKSVLYGTMTSFLDIRDRFVQEFLRDGDHLVVHNNSNLNPLCGDPALNMKKSVRIVFDANGTEMMKHYAEEFKEMDCHFKNMKYHRYDGWPKQIRWMESLIRNMRLRPSPALDRPVGAILHVAHLRLEDDAILHWSRENKMRPNDFYNLLADKYIRAIAECVPSEETVLILSNHGNNRVMEWLCKEERPFIFVEKARANEREKNASQDMHRAISHGNGVFIGNFDIFRMQGSTFSYFIMVKGRFQRHVLIDIERIHSDAYSS